LAQGENGRFWAEQFLQRKTQATWSAKPVVALINTIRRQIMEDVILIAVLTMMALYALIIVGCLKQPEW
jgi:hypothetical protein